MKSLYRTHWLVTVILIGVLVMRMYSANKPTLTSEADKTEIVSEKVGEVAVETKEDGKQYPTELAEKVKVAKGDNPKAAGLVAR